MKMDRKICVLIYSQYSPSSKTLIEYIQNLPYDLAKVTGMTLLSADSPEVRKMLLTKSVDHVPSLLVQYFNGTTQLLEREYIYKWIAAINKTIARDKSVGEILDLNNEINSDFETDSVVHTEDDGRKRTTLMAQQQQQQPSSTVVPSEYPIKSSSKDIMSAAMEMQKNREKDDAPRPPGAPPQKTLY
jgi:hypothetical protein